MGDKTKDVLSIEIKIIDGRNYTIKDKQSIYDIEEQLIGNKELHLGRFLSVAPGKPPLDKQRKFEHMYFNINHILSIKYLKKFD
ncbi:hypothetical protein IHQ11_27045 [Priestia megaterium]|uniref:hypothetical protein n=1 Tax=Priestia megaterium TaxID=1404 RepID=UPI001B3A3745|nr:hypothetical protein [Priestia megaterium]MBQ4870108.1 hypothetical protein [Priestia megaterium]